VNTWLCFNSASGFPFRNDIAQYSIARNAVELSVVSRCFPENENQQCDYRSALLSNKNQNPRCQRQDSHYDGRDGDVEQQSDSGENQVNGEQEHSEVFGDVHAGFFEAKSARLHALNCALLDITESSTEPESRHSYRVETFCRLAQLSRAPPVVLRDPVPQRSKDTGVRGLSLSLTR
jgi:hypothetical protein